MINPFSKLKFETRWNLRKAKRKWVNLTEYYDTSDEELDSTLNAIEVVSRIQNERLEKVSKVLLGVGSLAIMALIGLKGYEMDVSDGISHNRNSKSIFDRFFRFS